LTNIIKNTDKEQLYLVKAKNKAKNKATPFLIIDYPSVVCIPFQKATYPAMLLAANLGSG
jgi:hypothetical protein